MAVAAPLFISSTGERCTKDDWAATFEKLANVAKITLPRGARFTGHSPRVSG